MDKLDRTHRTDTLCPNKDVLCGPKIKHWVEIQLVDEHGEALPYLPYRAQNDATREGVVPEYRGQADADGVIRIEGLHPIPLTLLIDADPLAEVLQTRRLRAKRAEPKRPIIGDPTPLHCPQYSGHSPIEEQALAAGHDYHYVRIGQLSDKLPQIDPPFYKSREGLGAPYHTIISRTLPVKAKLFLVPSLSEADDEQARAAQQRYAASLTTESRDRYFPKGRNAKRGNLLGLRNHFMGKYQPYIYGQLIESINPSRMQERQENRRQLEAQMLQYGEKMPEDELLRDRLFLELQSLVGMTLECTRQIEGGLEALKRFEAVAEDNLYVEMTHG